MIRWVRKGKVEWEDFGEEEVFGFGNWLDIEKREKVVIVLSFIEKRMVMLLLGEGEVLRGYLSEFV